jgi:hypothetical protein
MRRLNNQLMKMMKPKAMGSGLRNQNVLTRLAGVLLMVAGMASPISAQGLTAAAWGDTTNVVVQNKFLIEGPRGLLVTWPGTRGVTLLIASDDHSVVYRGVVDRVERHLLPAGTYHARFSKEGAGARSLTFEITDRGRKDIVVDLSGRVEQRRGLARKRYWIIGAAVTAAAGSAILIYNNRSGGGASGGFPAPPGRP